MPPKISSTILKNLQAKCRASGLDATGTTEELCERLEEWQEQQTLPTPQSLLEDKSELDRQVTTSETCSEQLAEEDAQVEVEADTGGDAQEGSEVSTGGMAMEGSEADMDEEAQDASEADTNGDRLEATFEDRKHQGGQHRGLTLMDRIDKLKHKVMENGDRLQSLDRTAAALKSDNTCDREKLVSLHEQVASFAQSTPDYKILRNCFISTFVHEKLNKATELDMKIIGKGGPCKWALGGDMVLDAQLYHGAEGRIDYRVFKQLYGVFPQIAKTLTHMETIHILNNHAAVITSNYKQGSPNFYKQFARFVEQFEESGFDESYLQGEPTGVTEAYWSFLNCCQFEVART